jgi:hypothetical protein
VTESFRSSMAMVGSRKLWSKGQTRNGRIIKGEEMLMDNSTKTRGRPICGVEKIGDVTAESVLSALALCCVRQQIGVLQSRPATARRLVFGLY